MKTKIFSNMPNTTDHEGEENAEPSPATDEAKTPEGQHAQPNQEEAEQGDEIPQRKRVKDKRLKLDTKTQQIFTKKGYQIGNFLGAGSYGEVYRGTYLKSGKACAVKVMYMDKMSDRYKQKFLPRELSTLMELHHPYIIRLWDIIKAFDRIYIFMEFAPNGDLARYLKQGAMEEPKARHWFRQVANALEYMHEEMYIAHRDIKLDNILLADKMVAKLADFGFAVAALDDEGHLQLRQTFCGTLPYYSPQIVQHIPYNPFKADIWALGVVLYAMLHHRFPFHHRNRSTYINEQNDFLFIQARIGLTLSWKCRTLLAGMLAHDEASRLTIQQVRAHDWTRKEKDGFEEQQLQQSPRQQQPENPGADAHHQQQQPLEKSNKSNKSAKPKSKSRSRKSSKK